MLPIFQRAASFAALQFHRLVSLVKRYPVRAALALPALVLLYVLVLIPFTPGVGDLRKAKSELPSVLLASDGSVLAEYRRSNRRWVALDKISPNVVNALIATEDHRFYSHHGIDFRRTVGALVSTFRANCRVAQPLPSNWRAICTPKKLAAQPPSRAKSRKQLPR